MPLRFLRRALPFTLAAMIAPAPCLAGDDEGPGASDLARLAETVAPSLVVVEYTLRYDKGDAPEAGGRAAMQRAMQVFSRDESGDDSDLEGLIRDERPLCRAGYLLSDGRVVSRDTGIHPRFIASIAVRSDNGPVPASIDAYGKSQDALFLKPAASIAGARSLSFDTAASPPFFGVNYVPRSGTWTVGVGPAPTNARVEPASKRSYTPAPRELLVVGKSGAGVGLSFNGELPVNGSWKGAPAEWPMVTAAEMDKALAGLRQSTAASLPRVEIRFRSPRNTNDGGRRFRQMRQNDGENQITEWNGTGVLVNPTTVLVLADFKPKLTARIESVAVHGPDSTVPATFAGSLRDQNGFFVTLGSPMSGPAGLATEPITSFRDELLLKAEIGVLGEVRTAYLWRDRIQTFSLGWKGKVYPDADSGRQDAQPWEDAEYAAQNFLFDLGGRLVALPLGHREKVASREQYAYHASNDAMISGAMLAEILSEMKGSIDPENRPLSEEEENRLAWLGVELQPMDPDLARMNKVVDQTGGGRTGAVVTYLYPASPAAKAGIEIGDILLRLHIEGQPKPLDIAIEGGMEGMFAQIWAMYDTMPDEYFDQIPQPWGSAENTLTRALTDIGFGTPFTVDIFRDGKVINLDMVITEGPAHYNAARRFKSDAAGLTVRDLTYEARRYFQLSPTDPGVIISKVEKGGRGAVAGLKPYEIITSVGDAPIASVADFEKAIGAGGEFRLSVKRMSEGRIVKLKVAAATDQSPAPGGDAGK